MPRRSSGTRPSGVGDEAGQVRCQPPRCVKTGSGACTTPQTYKLWTALNAHRPEWTQYEGEERSRRRDEAYRRWMDRFCDSFGGMAGGRRGCVDRREANEDGQEGAGPVVSRFRRAEAVTELCKYARQGYTDPNHATDPLNSTLYDLTVTAPGGTRRVDAVRRQARTGAADPSAATARPGPAPIHPEPDPSSAPARRWSRFWELCVPHLPVHGLGRSTPSDWAAAFRLLDVLFFASPAEGVARGPAGASIFAGYRVQFHLLRGAGADAFQGDPGNITGPVRIRRHDPEHRVLELDVDLQSLTDHRQSQGAHDRLPPDEYRRVEHLLGQELPRTGGAHHLAILSLAVHMVGAALQRTPAGPGVAPTGLLTQPRFRPWAAACLGWAPTAWRPFWGVEASLRPTLDRVAELCLGNHKRARNGEPTPVTTAAASVLWQAADRMAPLVDSHQVHASHVLLLWALVRGLGLTVTACPDQIGPPLLRSTGAPLPSPASDGDEAVYSRVLYSPTQRARRGAPPADAPAPAPRALDPTPSDLEIRPDQAYVLASVRGRRVIYRAVYGRTVGDSARWHVQDATGTWSGHPAVPALAFPRGEWGLFLWEARRSTGPPRIPQLNFSLASTMNDALTHVPKPEIALLVDRIRPRDGPFWIGPSRPVPAPKASARWPHRGPRKGA